MKFTSLEFVKAVMDTRNMKEAGSEERKGRKCALDQDSIASRTDVTLYIAHVLVLSKEGSSKTVTYIFI